MPNYFLKPFSILLYYSYFSHSGILTSLSLDQKITTNGHSQEHFVLLCHRVTRNILRMIILAVSQWFQSDIDAEGLIPSFIYLVRWVQMTWSQVLCFQKSYTIAWVKLFLFRRNSIGVSMTSISNLSPSTHTNEHLFCPIPHSFQSYLDFFILSTKREVYSAHYTLSRRLFLPELLHAFLIATNINVKCCITRNESCLC